MAGTIINMPSNGASDWSNFVTIVEKTMRGYMGLSISNLDTSAAPAILDGSVIEINGSVFQFTTAETITGWPSAAGTTEYIVAVPSGSTATVIFTASAPTWSGTKNGWYDGNDRYIGELTWGGSASYIDKLIYRRYYDNDAALKFYGDGEIDAGSGEITAAGGINTDNVTYKTKEYSTGEWNMDVTASINITHGLTSANIRRITGIVQHDSAVNYYDLNVAPAGFTAPGAYCYTTGGTIVVARTAAGIFDSTSFDGTASTVPNRGYIWVDYV